MKGKTKPEFTADFKLKVVLEVLKEKDSLAVISKRNEIHPNQISDWKKQFLDTAPTLFETIYKVRPPRLNPRWPYFMNRLGCYRWTGATE